MMVVQLKLAAVPYGEPVAGAFGKNTTQTKRKSLARQSDKQETTTARANCKTHSTNSKKQTRDV